MKRAFYLLKFEHLIIFYPLYLLHRMKWKQRQNKGIRKKTHSSCFWVATLKTQSNNTLKSYHRHTSPITALQKDVLRVGNSNLQSGLTYTSQVLHGTTVQDEQFSPDWFTFSHIYMYIHKLLLFFLKECFPWFTRLHLCLSLQRTRSAVVVKAAAIISVTVTSVE